MFDAQPLFTDTCENITSLRLDEPASYLYGISNEERTTMDASWMSSHANSYFVRVLRQDDLQQTAVLDLGGEKEFLLRLSGDRDELVASLQHANVYIDITGLNHGTWAPVVQSALKAGKNVNVIYQEPESYRARRGTELQTKFELSDGRVIASLPGFERYEPIFGGPARPSLEREGRLLVLMGFEGDRFGFILTDQDFHKERVYPVVGVPGFRIEFVAHALLGNERPLRQIEGQGRLRYVPAYCPFSLAYLVEELLEEDLGGTITIAPIGTKPHALGAVLGAIAAPERIEIIYDHPLRRKDRSKGQGRTFVYHVSQFIHEWSLPNRIDITRLTA